MLSQIKLANKKSKRERSRQHKGKLHQQEDRRILSGDGRLAHRVAKRKTDNFNKHHNPASTGTHGKRLEKRGGARNV